MLASSALRGIDVVERGQRVEPQDVAVQVLRGLDDVADDARAVRDGDAECGLGRHGGGVAVRDRAHAADALRDVEGVRGLTALA